MFKFLTNMCVFLSILFGQNASIPDAMTFVNGTVSIPIIITDLVELEGFEFTIQFDETVLMAISTSFENSDLDGMNFNKTESLDNAGEIIVAAFAGGSLYNGSGILLFINFDVIGELFESTELIFTSIEVNNISIIDSAQDGSVTIGNTGCTDLLACNFNDLAEIDDGLCEYPLDNFDCDSNCIAEGGYDCNGVCGGDVTPLDYCLDTDDDGLGAGDTISYCLADLPSEGNFVEDCSDTFPNTYCISNNVDDCGVCDGHGLSCTDTILGCIDIDACNYNESATDNDGSCWSATDGCDCSDDEGAVVDVCGTCGGTESDVDNCLRINPYYISNFSINSIYPNPFNPITTINYSVQNFSVVTISIYSINGELIQTIMNSSQGPGQYAVQWNASNSPSGFYIIKLISENKKAEQKVLLVK